MKIEEPKLPGSLICFSHLRWDFVYQRPQHLMSHFARALNVYVFEEAIFDAPENSYLTKEEKQDNLFVLVPHLPNNLGEDEIQAEIKDLLAQFMGRANLSDWIFWYYTPMAFEYSGHYKAALTVFDCMDELSAFDFAPKELLNLEQHLLSNADIVFTGGYSLHEAKKGRHNNIHVFPSSIDKNHFRSARLMKTEPEDQAQIEGLKLGFIGVIDERFDAGLIKEIAAKRPDWQIILIGPVVKISQEKLPKGHNLHYLGQRSYAELPAYLAGWDVALIPFAIIQQNLSVPLKLRNIWQPVCR